MVPFELLKIDHIVLRIRDLSASKRFYVDALGCTVEKEQAEIGLFQLRAGRSLIDLVPISGPLGSRGGEATGAPFDAAAIITHLETHGVKIGELGHRYGAEGDGPSLYVSDPDGNTVELKGPPDRRSERTTVTDPAA